MIFSSTEHQNILHFPSRCFEKGAFLLLEIFFLLLILLKGAKKGRGTNQTLHIALFFWS